MDKYRFMLMTDKTCGRGNLEDGGILGPAKRDLRVIWTNKKMDFTTKNWEIHVREATEMGFSHNLSDKIWEFM